MVYNLRSGQMYRFTAVFFDADDAVTVPSSATLTITYPDASNPLTLASCAIAMTAAGDFFIATWASSVAALGLSSASATAPGQITSAPGLAETLRITG